MQLYCTTHLHAAIKCFQWNGRNSYHLVHQIQDAECFLTMKNGLNGFLSGWILKHSHLTPWMTAQIGQTFNRIYAFLQPVLFGILNHLFIWYINHLWRCLNFYNFKKMNLMQSFNAWKTYACSSLFNIGGSEQDQFHSHRNLFLPSQNIKLENYCELAKQASCILIYNFF